MYNNVTMLHKFVKVQIIEIKVKTNSLYSHYYVFFVFLSDNVDLDLETNVKQTYYRAEYPVKSFKIKHPTAELTFSRA